ncbi:MAG: type II toxin-antitoxin system RelE/ParE family toxin [Anaerovoracaceae bacterium]
MAYSLIITERAEEQLDNIVIYLLNSLKSRQGAVHLLSCVDGIYKRLSDNPFQFPISHDGYLCSMGYREAVMVEMQYKMIFKVDDENVFILGIFHNREKYIDKIE